VDLFIFEFHSFTAMSDSSQYINKFSNVFESALLAELEANSMVMEVPGGEVMLNPGQTIRAVPLVISGVFKVSRINEEGQELLLYYVREGESCAMTFTCCMMAHASVIKGSAEEDSVLLCVPVNFMDQWMTKYATWKRYVMTTILSRFTEILKSIDEVAFKKLDDRLASYLKEKSKVTGSSLVNLSHQQIADELGTNRVVVSRLLKKLEIDKKLLLYRNQIKLLKDM
jgi:CRP/FNR family transcriptional regulator, anaerobic regulatory protein